VDEGGFLYKEIGNSNDLYSVLKESVEAMKELSKKPKILHENLSKAKNMKIRI